MPNASSKKPVRRRFTSAQKATAVAYAAEHTVPEAAVKFKVHPSAIYSWRKGSSPGKPAAKVTTVPREIYMLANKLGAALKQERMKGGELSDVEIYATLLIRKLTERGTS